MQNKAINEAVTAARVFLKRYGEYVRRAEEDPDFDKYKCVVGYRESGALRRASMELSRALSRMRKP